MSYHLEFPSLPPLPNDVNSPPYAVFGIHGSDITSSLPPHIPLNLVLHFAPALQKWVLPIPDPKHLPRIIAGQVLRTPYVGIDIQAPIDAVGLSWIIIRMLHLSGRKVPKETFGLHPDLATSIATHNAWHALELPLEGVRSLHTHIYSMLVYTEPPVSIWGMCLLWDAFPADSEILKAMGLNFIRGHINMEYSPSQSLEIIAWFQSTPERYALFNSLRYAMPEVPEPEIETITMAAEEVKAKVSGYKKIGSKVSKAIKAVIFGTSATKVRDVGIMERGATRKVSPQERQDREASDFEALRRRLKRTRSDDSLRSVNTVIWDPQTPGEKKEEVKEEEEVGTTVNDDMNDEGNYSGGSISTELARTLESIRLRREARSAKHKRAPSLPTVQPRARSDDGEPSSTSRPRHRRCSSTTTEKDYGLAVADLQRRIHVLKEKQNGLVQESTKVTAMTDDGDDGEEFEEGSAFVDLEGFADEC